MTPDERIAEFVRASCEEQGVPERISDPLAVVKVAALLDPPEAAPHAPEARRKIA